MIDLILEDCLKDIRDGHATLADCLAKYPDQATELAPLLGMASALQAVDEVKPSLEFRQATRARLVALSSQPVRREHSRQTWFSFMRSSRAYAAIALALVIVMFGLSAAIVDASSESLPGTLLYPVKRATEQAQLFLATDAASQARVHLQIANHRLTEMVALSQQGQDHLAEQTIGEYDAEINNALEITTTQIKQNNSSIQNLTQGLANQQKKLQESQPSSSSEKLVQRALTISGKALGQLSRIKSEAAPSATATEQPTPGTPTPFPTLPALLATPPAAQPTIDLPPSPKFTPPDRGKPSDVPKPTREPKLIPQIKLPNLSPG